MSQEAEWHNLIVWFDPMVRCPLPKIQRCLWYKLRVLELHVEEKVEQQTWKQSHTLTRCCPVWLGQYTGMLYSIVAYTGLYMHPFRLIYLINKGYNKTGSRSYKSYPVIISFPIWCVFKIFSYVHSYVTVFCSIVGLVFPPSDGNCSIVPYWSCFLWAL